ncbi:MAG: ABC transporter ATP-binding protein [Burkholderiales bacterium]
MLLEVRGIDVRYGAAPALNQVSIDVAEGELVCVVGPNGAGKSTLINAIAGLHPVASGSMSFNGRDLTRLPPHRFCDAGIAIVPEGRRLFTGMSVRENLMLGSYRPQARKTRAASLDRVCGLFPALVEKMDAPAGSLSGGQQQMVAIARALMAGPRLLLLDEPSLGLSPLIVQTMFSMIERIHAEGVAVLLVEQNVSLALGLASRAYVLEEGAIVACDTPDTLKQQPHIRRAYLGIVDTA